MKTQVLVATMNQEIGDYSLLKKMNIQTDAIICNQCDRNQFEKYEWGTKSIRWLSFAERGVGLNRNNALMRASSELVIFADDDMTYVDGYEKIITDAFIQVQDADVIIFNLEGSGYNCRGIKRIGWYNFMKYGAARISARLTSLRHNGITFNLSFGGGTEFCHGEDTLFLADCLKRGLRIYTFPVVIASLSDKRGSTWFRGYTDTYLKDTGMLYRVMSRRWWKLLCLQDAIRHAGIYKRPWHKSYQLMIADEPK